MSDETNRLVSLPPIFSDQPIDAAEGSLAFEFDKLAIVLAQLALNPGNATPFTVVVRGGWGRGKTTLLRRVKHLLKHPELASKAKGQRKVGTLWFNAWKYPNEDTVLAGLLGALLDQMRTGNPWVQLKLLADEYKGSLFGKALRLAAPPALRQVIPGSGEEGRFSAAARERAFHDTFRTLFCQLSCLYLDDAALAKDIQHRSETDLWDRAKAKGRSLAIFLDDLDRCRPKRVREVLEAINLFLDLPGVCFYLGVDWDRLKTCLEDVEIDDREEYLEKIVQVKLDLPVVSREDGGKFVTELLDQARGTELAEALNLGKEGDETSDLAKILESCHPRHIKRFLNDLSIAIAILEATGKLGAGDEQVTKAAVLAWHLLNEVLAEQTWKEVRLSGRHLRRFLDQALKEPAEAKKEAAKEQAPEGEVRQAVEIAGDKRKRIQRHLETLGRLTDKQLHVLVHVASPPASPEPAKGKKANASDLLDLYSGAWVELEAKEAFQMGSEDGRENERPVHPVRLSPYWMARHPVTNSDFAAYLKEVEVKEPPKHWVDGKIPPGRERHPVVNVSWQDATAYCAWLTKKLEAKGEKGKVTLPTEAQWEFAARGHTGRKYPWGGDDPDEERANFEMKVGDTTPVGAYPKGATEDGIYDLAGNVWEWCQDRYADHYEEGLQIDPEGPKTGSSRVVRGGSFDLNFPRALRGAYRFFNHPEFRGGSLGFRVVFVVA